MERNVSFRSGGLKLSAVLRIPNGMQQGERRPAFVVLHGFGSTKDAGNVIKPTEMLSAFASTCAGVVRVKEKRVM